LYEELRVLEQRAKTARLAAGRVYSRRETARAAGADPYRTVVDSRRLSTWLPEDPAAAQVPRADSDQVRAIVRAWSTWDNRPTHRR
jgi:hypothetical protein